MTTAELRHQYRIDPFYYNVVNSLVVGDLEEVRGHRDFFSRVSTEFWVLGVCFLVRDSVAVMMVDPEQIRKVDAGWEYGAHISGVSVVFAEEDVLVLRSDNLVDFTTIKSAEQMQAVDLTLFQKLLPTIQEFIGDRETHPR